MAATLLTEFAGGDARSSIDRAIGEVGALPEVVQGGFTRASSVGDVA